MKAKSDTGKKKRMKPYNHSAIEKKHQKASLSSSFTHAEANSKKDKFYCLIEFPYPSGDGLHVGHVRSYTAMDVVARKKRAEGYNVLYPIGWDAFGLPTENFAIKTGKDPRVITKKNTDTFRKQLQSLGISFDWKREINTTDPEYYRWTQWIFLKFLEHDLAYKAKVPINWCPKDKIGLANEEVVDGACERCGTPVEKREKEQWMLRITKYADRLDSDLDSVDYLPKIKLQQRNWIGKSEGAEIEFQLTTNNSKLKTISVFTTRPDTIFGATYIVLSPEHPLLTNNELGIQNFEEVQKYIADTKKKTEIERTDNTKKKTGVKLDGIFAINPATKEKIPVYIADYVLAGYGTGAVMAVPAHDERDFAFAKTFNLSIRKVVDPSNGIDAHDQVECWTGDGLLIESGAFSGLQSANSKKEITKFVGGKWVNTYKLRDWVFSRQRYWGEPIPVIHCETCGTVPVPEKDLPVLLPKVKKYEPTDTGESPLASITSWVNVECPTCKGKAKRETDVMPNWAGSSWYFLRYTDPHNKKEFASSEALKEFMPVDWYNGGMEHTTLHLLYSRFWNKFLYDLKLVPHSEPYKKRTSHGLILASDGEKMSKSRGNVVNPDQIVKQFGADTLRVYEMFMGPFDQAIAWSEDGVVGPRRFIERVWALQARVSDVGQVSKELETLLHKTIKRVSDDIETMGFNTAISALMILANELEKSDAINTHAFETFLKLLSPFAPHITEELYAVFGNTKSIHEVPWPQYDESKLISESVTIVVQVNGKVRASLIVPRDLSQNELLDITRGDESVQKWLEGKEVKRVIYVKNKLLSLVLGS